MRKYIWSAAIVLFVMTQVMFGVPVGTSLAILLSALCSFMLFDRIKISRAITDIIGNQESGRASKSGLSDRISIWLGLDRIRYRLETLSWENSVIGARNSGDDVIVNSQALNGDRDLLLAALSKLNSQFRHLSSALIVVSGSNGNQTQILSAGPLPSRVERFLCRLYSPFFEHGLSNLFGIHECVSGHSPIMGLSSLGYKWLISYPVQWRTGEIQHRAVLWLGYAKASSPSTLEEQLVRSFALRLERELASSERLRELSGQICAVEGMSRQKSDYIAQMSHDIRSPLNNIRSILTLFQLDGFKPDTPSMIQVALSNCDSLGEIVEDILDYSKHSSGNLFAVCEQVSVGSIITSVAESFSYGARMKGLEIVINMEEDELLAICDRRHLKRIMSNLISNAVKYTQHGRILVETKRTKQGDLEVSVSDTGPGIVNEQLSQLFKPFTRFHGPEVEGVGLGLAVTRILAEKNDATLTVESIVGVGSTFKIRFKASPAWYKAEQKVQPASSVREDARLTPQRIGCGKSVLIIDDDVDCVDTLALGMERMGFKTLRAVKVSDAIGITNYEPVDLVITDATMPDGGGRRLISYLHSTKPNLAVVVFSGKNSPEETTEFERLGAIGVFAKPVDLALFEAWLRDLYQPKLAQAMVA